MIMRIFNQFVDCDKKKYGKNQKQLGCVPINLIRLLHCLPIKYIPLAYVCHFR